MQVIHDIETLRGQIRAWRGDGRSIAFVPTMGNLHDGHLRLVETAAQTGHGQQNNVVVSIFVNPLQFGQGEDFNGYPRTLEADLQRLRALAEVRGIALLVFAPSVATMYPDGPGLATRISVSGVSEILCGQDRPGHFTGVATVVSKLFNLVQPDVALFGRKDYQQLQVIRRMVRDLSMPVEIVGVDTMRESDGLAMSSRNAYLDAQQRALAPKLQGVLQRVAEQLRAGQADMGLLEAEGRECLADAGLVPDYVSIRRQQDLAQATAGDRKLVVLAAARLGRARLIDNIELNLDEPGLNRAG